MASDELRTVFVSYTSELAKYPEKPCSYIAAALEGIRRAGFVAKHMLDYAAVDLPAADVDARHVRECDVYLGVIGLRWGSPVLDRPDVSYTQHEFEVATESGKPRLIFVLDDEAELPLPAKAVRDVEYGDRQEKFRHQVKSGRICIFFSDPNDLEHKVEKALCQLAQQATAGDSDAHLQDVASDPDAYLRSLRSRTGYIDIRGLRVGGNEAPRFGIDELYIPLKTDLPDERAFDQGERRPTTGPKPDESTGTELHSFLVHHRRAVIVGDPGSGKSTFVRRIAHRLCETHVKVKPPTAAEELGLADNPFPLLIRVSEFIEHQQNALDQGRQVPRNRTAAAWLEHYLSAASEDDNTPLGPPFFHDILQNGRAIVLLDGLDEAPSEEGRKTLVEFIENAVQAYDKCRFVITTRPAAYQGEAVLPGFEQVQIAPLEEDGIEFFLTRWYEALFPESRREAQRHRDELLGAIRDRIELKLIAQTPVMLTAMAVVHWHESRLPEQRADLYESILRWLSRARNLKKTQGRPSPDRCVVLLQELALAMQNHPEGRQVQVPRRWAAEQIASQWRELPKEERVGAAEQFLFLEELDSGIIVGRGDHVRFWHLTFQEFLAARGLAARAEAQQQVLLFDQGKFYEAEWREVVVLLAGVLHHQGKSRVDALYSAALEDLQNRGRSKQAWKWSPWPHRVRSAPTLSDQARCVGLLGAAAQDLKPYDYEPDDPGYQSLLNDVLGIFDPEMSKGVTIRIAIEAAEALGQAGDPRLRPGDADKNWIPIPAGEFLMGSQSDDPSQPHHDPDARRDEGPVHEVCLDAYQIGRYPVTVLEYRRFMDADGYEQETFWQAGGFGEFQRPRWWQQQLLHPNRPVVGVSWFEAAAYAVWIGRRLPAEAEWERAARGTEGRKYPWGDARPTPRLLNYSGGKVGHPTPVGLYPGGATPDSIQDLAGNVFEWCGDWYGADYYRHSPREHPCGPKTGECRVLRGGAFNYRKSWVRATFRINDLPIYRYYNTGFRLARS